MIKIGICGYGNLGKGVEKALLLAKDMELVGIFTRRDPASLNHPLAYQMEDLKKFENKIDVLILCGGSATDLPIQTPMLAGRFNVVDSFDTHAKIKEHFDNVDQNARLASKTAIISTGWDPGLFSLNRIYMESVLPNGKDYTFWGKGVSQGHSDAIRRIKGVKNAKQYTIPKEEALELVRKGVQPNLSVRDKHLRECFVVLENEANPEVVEKEIKEMPNYFSDYDTIVHFISEEELLKNHSGIPHGGFVIRTGNTSDGVTHQIEYRLQLDSNPEFTGSVLVGYARACFRLNQEGIIGCQTVFDVAPKYLSSESYEELLKHTL
ncbi:MAG: diaminopimelate dehydrogenase [Anaeroplasmataceae bacterium]|nr:diaminopimelate dehydrogenase [Anaeroplasmataceae bacterium]MDE5868396.1 diaminopimelate dehydrogenase [Anaeroplasmataceae bacterium]